MDEFDDLKMTDSEDDEGAGERVRMIMEEIYKNQDKIKSDADIEQMAERCTNMMTQMRNDAYLKKKGDKKGYRASGSGDKASPPASRSSPKESPRKDSTKTTPSPRLGGAGKPLSKDQRQQQQKMADMYKDKLEKMRVPGKMDLMKTGATTKSDSTAKAASKSKAAVEDFRKKIGKVAALSSDSESSSMSSESESGGMSDEELRKALENSKAYNKLMKERGGLGGMMGTKVAEAHKKTMDWMSSTRKEQTKKKEGASGSMQSKPSTKPPFYSSSDEMDSEDEKLAQQLKSKMTMPSKKPPPSENKDALKKLMASMNEKVPKSLSSSAKAAPSTQARRPSVAAGGGSSRLGMGRGAVAGASAVVGDKAKPRKKV